MHAQDPTNPKPCVCIGAPEHLQCSHKPAPCRFVVGDRIRLGTAGFPKADVVGILPYDCYEVIPAEGHFEGKNVKTNRSKMTPIVVAREPGEVPGSVAGVAAPEGFITEPQDSVAEDNQAEGESTDSEYSRHDWTFGGRVGLDVDVIEDEVAGDGKAFEVRAAVSELLRNQLIERLDMIRSLREDLDAGELHQPDFFAMLDQLLGAE